MADARSRTPKVRNDRDGQTETGRDVLGKLGGGSDEFAVSGAGGGSRLRRGLVGNGTISKCCWD
mgnify:CR=1 FL=1